MTITMHIKDASVRSMGVRIHAKRPALPIVVVGAEFARPDQMRRGFAVLIVGEFCVPVSRSDGGSGVEKSGRLKNVCDDDDAPLRGHSNHLL